MVNTNYSCRLVTKSDLEELNVSFESLLMNNSKCLALMGWYHVKLSTIVKIIEKLNIPYSAFFKYSTYSYPNSRVAVTKGLWDFSKGRSKRIERCETTIYIIESSYDSLGWNKVARELFKMKYPSLWKLFRFDVEMTYKYGKNMSASDFLDENHLNETSMEDVIKIFQQVKRGKTKFYRTTTLIDVYVHSENDNTVYFRVTNNNSLYVCYDDLYRCLHGEFDVAWDNISKRIWYMDRIQGNEEWFNSPKAIELKNELKRLSDNFNSKKR